MTDEQLTAEFEAALAEWNDNHEVQVNRNTAQFFFFAGSESGCKATAEIYIEAYGETHVSDAMLTNDDVSGVPV